MKSLTNIIKKGARNLAILTAVAGGLTFGAGQAKAQDKVFSPKHVTADNPQGIVTGGYKAGTANYEDEMSRLKSTNGTWYGDQVVNPFIRPGYRDKDMGEREYYGSKDVNGNHLINELADAQAIYDGNTSYRGDVNGDGVTNSTDAGIIQSVIERKIPYAPSDWNYLTRQEKIDYFEKLVELDDTNTFHEGWDCSQYSGKFWLKFSGLEKAAELKNEEYTYDYLSGLINMNTENGIFNLPVYKVSTTATNGEVHAINAIFVGDNNPNFESTIDFDDWCFFEPQTDKIVFQGDFSMRNNEGDVAKIERLCYNEYPGVGPNYGTMPVVIFNLHPSSVPTLKWKHPGLVTSRPTNPVSGVEDIVNPFGEPTLSVFPNPVRNGQDFNIVNSTGQFDENGKLVIYDLAGRLVYEQKPLVGINNKIIIPSDEINSFANGMYIINYISTKEKASAKMQKQILK